MTNAPHHTSNNHPTMKLTPIQKQQKIARGNLDRLIKHLKAEWSFGRLKTVESFLTNGLGYTIEHVKNVLHYQQWELDHLLTFPELKDKIADLQCEVEARLFLEQYPPQMDTEVVPIILPKSSVTIPTKELEKASKIIDDDINYGLPPSEKEKAFLFWFQKKFAKMVLDKLTIDQLQAILLIAQAGTGKTFILGAVLRRLIDMQFHKGKTMAPWPYCYITKASVVEQTKRVLEAYFQIDVFSECFITNYDQMRAKFGQIFVNEKTIVKNGEEEVKWTWRSKIHPCVFIIDESQAAKNDISTQSKIICSIADIPTRDVFCIFSSATPFTRVSEAKYFVLNARIDRKLW